MWAYLSILLSQKSPLGMLFRFLTVTKKLFFIILIKLRSCLRLSHAATACCDPLPLNARDVDVADGRNGTARTALLLNARCTSRPRTCALPDAGRTPTRDGVHTYEKLRTYITISMYLRTSVHYMFNLWQKI